MAKKLPGKTAYSGRRRTTTRRSGFVSHPESTGGECKFEQADRVFLHGDTQLTFEFNIPEPTKKIYAGFGGYFRCDTDVQVNINNPNFDKNLLDHYELPDWSKFGSMWITDSKQETVSVSFLSPNDTELDIYEFACGLIWHEYFDGARQNIMKNMHKISPEGNYYVEAGEVVIPEIDIIEGENEGIVLKSCNRCARYLPINICNERNHLSFSNHCVARAPCTHGGFGRLTNVDTRKEVQLYHGYQLECRLCKKYAVNAALNPQRTAAQMKEDGQRRRHFELMLTELYQMSPQLAYRHKTGRELTDDIWNRFNKMCFNCNVKLKTANEMHLDHTRPLALLWPLDETATALCSTCNSQKRDRFPSEFYTEEQLTLLADICGLELDELKNPDPNHAAIIELLENKKWLFNKFLTRQDLMKERDGKITAELVVKALDKVLERSSVDYGFSFVKEYERMRDG
jgi:hypothetical protein